MVVQVQFGSVTSAQCHLDHTRLLAFLPTLTETTYRNTVCCFSSCQACQDASIDMHTDLLWSRLELSVAWRYLKFWLWPFGSVLSGFDASRWVKYETFELFLYLRSKCIPEKTTRLFKAINLTLEVNRQPNVYKIILSVSFCHGGYVFLRKSPFN